MINSNLQRKILASTERTKPTIPKAIRKVIEITKRTTSKENGLQATSTPEIVSKYPLLIMLASE